VKIKIAFASGSDDLNRALIAQMRGIFPELPLWVVSDFPPDDKDLRWIPWHTNRTLGENLARARAAIHGHSIRLAGVMLVPNVPFRRMRLMALLLAPARFLAFNENLNNFMLRPGSLPAILRHFTWRARNFFRSAARAASDADWSMIYAANRARLAARFRPIREGNKIVVAPALEVRTEVVVSHDLRHAVSGTRAARLWFAPATTDTTTLEALERAFIHTPDLFCATAAPVGGFVLCGSLNGTLFDTNKLRALLDTVPLDTPPDLLVRELGYRAWQQGWPSIAVPLPSAPPAPSSKMPPADRDLDAAYLSFLARTVQDSALFRRLWNGAIASLVAARSLDLLRNAASVVRHACVACVPSTPLLDEPAFLALTSGDVGIFEGRPPSARPRILVASPYLPFPLSHGGAVRMYNLMFRAARDFDQVLICFTDALRTPAPELLGICAEIVLVRRTGSHELPSRGRPDTVEEFDSPAFHAALRLAVRKWQPAVAQLEFTQMAQYAPDCAPARTLLVEHDVTLDLYQQMIATATHDTDCWEVQRQFALWQRFEHRAWQQVDRVVLMSDKDRRLVAATGSRSEPVTLPNGVDLERFRPSEREPEPRRLLFIGSFAHLPNLMALEFFLHEVWPALTGAALHIISGANHEYFLDFYRDRIRLDLTLPGIELAGFVSDVRPAYERAAVVIVPLVASAGTNIKVLEAMAMGKAVVSTPAGVNGLDLTPGEDFLLTCTAAEMSAAISQLFDDPAARAGLELGARRTAEREYGWDAIAARQAALYRECAS